MMNFNDFKSSLNQDFPPQHLSAELKALWYDGKGNWNKAHNVAQEIQNLDGAWIHAYLHRKEGDLFNAGYWYSKAKKAMPTIDLEEEWGIICQTLLEKLVL